MKSYSVSAPGIAPDFDDADVPDPEPGEVRVRISAASVNGFDLAVAAGYMTPFFEHRYPLTLGREFAGVVDAIGDGVEGFAVGDRVLGVVSKPHLKEGAFAEYTTVHAADGLVAAPAVLSDSEAASLAHTGSTAVAILDALGPDVDGKTVLVVGATGGVGTLLVQLAASAGASVIATGRTEEGRAVLRELGATHTVDYRDGLEAPVRALAPGGVDVAVHLSGDADEIAGVVADGGAVISPLLYDPQQFAHEQLTLVPVAAYPNGATLKRIARLVDVDGLRVIVDREFAWADTPAALSAYGRETVGNLVVLID